MKRNTKLWKGRKKSIGRAPKWLKTVAIAKPRRRRMAGTFGPASEAISVDPTTKCPKAGAPE